MLLKYDEFLEYIARVAELAKFTGSLEKPEEDEAGEESETIKEDATVSEKDEKAILPSLGMQEMPIGDRVFKVIDMIVKLCPDPKLSLKAVKPMIMGLGDSESDYDEF